MEFLLALRAGEVVARKRNATVRRHDCIAWRWPLPELVPLTVSTASAPHAPPQSIEETSIAEAQALFDTNVFGALRTSQAVLPHMRKQRSGRIINVSSVLGFLPAPYMGLYSATKHAIEGLSETLDHEVRNFGVRVVLVEPSYTKTNLDLNAPQAANRVAAYDAERDLVSKAIVRSVQKAPGPDTVAATIVDAAFGNWKMRRTPKGEASLLRKLRRFMPAGPVDASLRKTFGLA